MIDEEVRGCRPLSISATEWQGLAGHHSLSGLEEESILGMEVLGDSEEGTPAAVLLHKS